MSENILPTVVVRRARESDIAAMARINSAVFLGDRDRPASAYEWMHCWFRAFPLYQYFVAELDGKVAGYIGWQVHGGFLRAEPVVELEQLGVDPAQQGKKIGPRLVDASVAEIMEWVKNRNNRIESHIAFIVWGYALNFNAMKVYAERFTDGVVGMRIQYGNRAESMLRWRVPVVRPVRPENTE